MTISKDLFLAILSMDSYNRGYGAGIADAGPNDPNGLGESSDGSVKIGKAIISYNLEDAEISEEAQAAGFYAIAYDTQYGTVISYRGTDAGWDYLKGWLIGGGLTSDWTQADEALAFYSAVTGKDYWEGPAANTIVTGHSLGGGLAGLVSALTGTQGYGFDNMPFGIAAWGVTLTDDVENPELDFSNFNEFSVANEILESVRNGTVQSYIGTILGSIAAIIGQPALAAALTSLGASESELTQYFESLIPGEQKHILESHSGTSGWELIDRAVRLHMIDYLIQIQFAEERAAEFGDWKTVGAEFFNAYFSDEVATAAGAESLTGVASITGKMGRAIAYSALDDGSLIFGDSGIRAMFGDLNELGQVYASETAATRADGSTVSLYDVALGTDATDTIFRGEKRVADWLSGGNALPNARGYGAMPTLAAAASNDFGWENGLKRAA